MSGMIAVCVGIVATVIPGFMLGSLFVEIGPDLNYGASVSGMVVASFFGASAFLSAPLGRWVDRRGPAATVRAALVSSAVLQGLLAVGARDAWSLAALASAAGAANALCQVSSNVWIARFVDPRRQGLAFAAKQSSMPAAALVAGLAIPVVALRVGWRWAFGIGVALAIVALGLLGSLADERSPARLRRNLEAPTGGRRSLVWLALAAALSSGAAVTLGSFFVDSAVDVGLTKSGAGYLLAVGSLVSIGSRLAAGSLADRREGDLLGVVAVMLSLGALSYLILTWRSPASHLLGLGLAFGAGWAWPGVFNLSVVRANPDGPGRATGITQSGTYVGAAGGPLVFGVLADRVSYPVAWCVAALIGAGAAVSVLLARRALRSDARASRPAIGSLRRG
jgi:MFS family permease